MTQDRLRALIRRHCETMAPRLDALDEILSCLQTGEADIEDCLGAARDHAHMIAGASGTIGFAAVSAAAAALERQLDDMRALRAARALNDAGEIAKAVALMKALRKAAADATPENSDLYHADLFTHSGSRHDR